MGDMAPGLPLSTLLSQVLVAFTIEFDNEFERQMPHFTTTTGLVAPPGVPAAWLVSLVMWSNFMRFVPEEGVPLRELQGRARITKEGMHTSSAGLERWGYVTVRPDPADSRSKPPRTDWVVCPTAAGRKAQEVWRPLLGVIEGRWQARFGPDEFSRLEKALQAVVSDLEVGLPDYLPLARYETGLLADDVQHDVEHDVQHEDREQAAREHDLDSARDLSALLSKVLLAFTIDFERESDVSLAIGANLLRVLDEEGVRVRELPSVSGVSKEATSVSVGFLEKRGCLVVEPDPTASRAKLVRLTAKGREAQDTWNQLLRVVEKRWEARLGNGILRDLRESLEAIIDRRSGDQPLLSAGLLPHPGGWRASKPYIKQTNAVLDSPRERLPHYPMVTHRGGFPDGS